MYSHSKFNDDYRNFKPYLWLKKLVHVQSFHFIGGLESARRDSQVDSIMLVR